MNFFFINSEPGQVWYFPAMMGFFFQNDFIWLFGYMMSFQSRNQLTRNQILEDI